MQVLGMGQAWNGIAKATFMYFGLKSSRGFNTHPNFREV